MMALQRKDIVTGGDMRTPVIFYKAKPSDDFFPGETVEEVVYQCFADVYQPSQKDLDLTNNEASLTMVTYHPIDIEISNDMYFEIQLPSYKNKKYNIQQVIDDTNDHRNIKIIGKLSE
ncbi:phage head-tail adapter protein [Staphylococcus haemolyticus]|uniref:phage head-tail adapter protein n=1 Tax=Staphylococcus haemolyticus TaxID=1283 RepID=UPI001F5846F4|nr:phage head-tail adapter protein [Staphylococcus haemolyticus]MCI2942690.1 phage head-tail adapter protein [Staphylococcus haemolyticus]MCI2944758.1 phage head-tail adapter protein [Staphylococcus haemolyticus]